MGPDVCERGRRQWGAWGGGMPLPCSCPFPLPLPMSLPLPLPPYPLPLLLLLPLCARLPGLCDPIPIDQSNCGQYCP